MASTVIGALSVEITADMQGVQDGIKATGKALKIGGEQLREQSNKWAKWALGATTAAAGVATALVKSNLTNIRELKNLSDRANTNVADFQRMSFAAGQYGIEQDKLSDILLDFNDRVGDFVTTGAGPMVDFFEQIGPKVGVTIDDFAKLSGPQGLQLYVDSLEKANLNQKEMTFFMEAMASDSTNLLPLLKDGGKAMQEQAKQAKALGIGLSAIDVAKAAEAQQKLDLIATVMGNELMKATAELSPVITAIANSFIGVAKESGGFAQFALGGFRTVGNAAAVFGDGIHGLRVIFKGLEVIARAVILEISEAFDVLAFGSIQEIGRSIADFVIKPLKKTLEFLAKFSDTAKAALNGIDNQFDNIFGKPKEKLGDFAQAQKEALDKTKADWQELASEELPSQAFTKWFNDIEAEAAETSARLSETIGAAVSPKIEPQQADTGFGKGDEAQQNEADTGFGKGDEAQQNEADRLREESEQMLEALLERGEMKSVTTLGQLEKERTILEKAYKDKKITEEQYAAASIALEDATTKAKNQIAASGFEAAAQALSKGGKKAQKIGKKLAIVGALIKGKQAAVDAWQAGMATGGPWAPAVAAAYTAASLAQTGSIISSIRGGGSSVPSSGGGTPSIPSGGSIPNTAPQQSETNQQAETAEQARANSSFAPNNFNQSENRQQQAPINVVPIIQPAPQSETSNSVAQVQQSLNTEQERATLQEITNITNIQNANREPQQAAPTTNIVELEFNSDNDDKMITQEDMRNKFIPALNEAIGDGVEIKIT